MSRTLIETTQPAFWENDAAGRRVIGRIAGILFSAGGLATVPAYRLMENPTPPSAANLLPFLAFISGIVCFLVPWDRVRPAWFHLVPALGTLEVAFSAWVLREHGNVISFLYVFVVVFAALAFCERMSVGAHVALASLALAAPILYMPAEARDNLVRTLVALPTLVVAAAVVALALLDLNEFKQVNESHGHLEGDRLLREVARALVDTVRGQDTVVRQGGDEFSVLAPESGAVDALALSRRIQRSLRKLRVGDLPLTTSIGYAVFPENGTTADALLAAADSALWRSKHESRAAQAS